MPYCPECLTEYVEGTTLCEDCRVALVPGAPPPRQWEWGPAEDVKMVRVRTFSGPTAAVDADLARNILQMEGIPSIVSGKTSAILLPELEVLLVVREQDAERAVGVLRAYFDSPGPTTLPSCEA